ncbi:VOC family protein [Aquella oligotrophica]|uniref:PhnB-like domain-containing protein n=1 Tax=Aquella oligotrophica TaxID=2067065 RepID=A0A2I7N7I9_9NEIS|nr:VOC family protein [Aquella oligotrophica]AUR52175.1 hypothetical protein CUN60_07640 [Aquella oligotrophica]
MQKIVPHLWFDKEAKEAAEFYVSVFPQSEINQITTLHDTPSGNCDIVNFNISGYSFMAISAGPYFKVNPSISFMLNFDDNNLDYTIKEMNRLWETLAKNGKIMMPLQKYPFSNYYGWVEDKYGVSWQLILNKSGENKPFITPSLMFVGNVAGKAEEATDFYLSIFKNSFRNTIAYYPAAMELEKEGSVMFTSYNIEGQEFAAMDSSLKHDFSFNEAISLVILCETQEEIDYYWQKLSAVSEAEQCGWVKDKYGISWQIVPTIMNEMMKNGTQEQINQITKAFLPMKKMDISALKKAYEGH